MGQFGHLLVVNKARLLIEPVWEGFEVLGDSGDLLGRRLIAVGQMTAVREIETEDTVVRVEDS